MLEKSSKLLPFLSILIVTLGFVYFRSFYSSFGIQIADFLELSEVLTLFLEELYILCFSIISYIIFNISLYISSYRRAKEEARINDIKIKKASSFIGVKDRVEKKNLVKRKFQGIWWRMSLAVVTFAILAYSFTYKYLDLLDLISVVVYGGYVGLIFGEYVADLEVFGRTKFVLLGGNPLQMVLLILFTLNTTRALSKIKVNLVKILKQKCIVRA